MHKLDRPSVTKPACLASYNYQQHTWEDMSSLDKGQIRNSLKKMQDCRCAYCEGPIYSSNGHIEHFRRKNQAHFPNLTFAWSNLFLSCDYREHCGHYKDRPSASCYNPVDIVKPDIDDPDQFFYFHFSGEVHPRSGIDTGPRRAKETIRVFNLNCGVLKAKRRRTLSIYIKKEPGILETLMEFEEADRQQFIADEIKATQTEPYWTVIRHFFGKV